MVAFTNRSGQPLPFVIALVIAAIWGSQSSAQPIQIFELPGDSAQYALVTTTSQMPDLSNIDLESPSMVLRMHGILEIVKGRELAMLLRSAPPARESIDLPNNATQLFGLHLIGQNMRRSYSICLTDDGEWIAEEAVGMLAVMPRRVMLDAARFEELAAAWPRFTGAIDDANKIQKSIVARLDHPYVPGWPYMDDRTLKSRTFVAGPGEQVGATRRLADETLQIRLPKNCDAREPAGLLVWVSAMSNGAPPAVFNDALDALNIICIGADDSGNDRPVADRYQLALDAVATASARFHVDRRRVYVTGISGGGRISSMLWATTPEVFTGAIPIVGINYFKAIPTGDGRSWPATYKRPRGELYRLMKEHRIAAMTGPPDFNYEPTVATIKLMQRDGFDVKLFEYPDMAHQMPTAERFLEALRWIDAPYQELRESESAASQKWLDEYTSRFGSVTPRSEEGRGLLDKAIEAGPWTAPAWQAMRLLGQTGGS